MMLPRAQEEWRRVQVTKIHGEVTEEMIPHGAGSTVSTGRKWVAFEAPDGVTHYYVASYQAATTNGPWKQPAKYFWGVDRKLEHLTEDKVKKSRADWAIAKEKKVERNRAKGLPLQQEAPS